MKSKSRNNSDKWQERRSGQEVSRPQSQYRNGYVRDRARVIHSAGFRRLQAKTQVLGIGEGDFHRTRLTHSMEVAQIARGIVYHQKQTVNRATPWVAWLPDPNLIETIALAHDLGHPPFGHGGEVSLNFAMKDSGGFEGNGQTLRLLARNEAHTQGYGLDLTRRCLLGVLKYPVAYETVVRKTLPEVPQNLIQLRREDWKPPKCYMSSERDVVEWILAPFSNTDRKLFLKLRKAPTDLAHGKSQYHAFDTSIMELGDDIAYGVHDFEDAIALNLVDRDDWIDVTKGIDKSWARSLKIAPIDKLTHQLFLGTNHERKRAIGSLVNAFIVSVKIKEQKDFEHPLLRFNASLSAPAEKFLDKLKGLIVRKVIKTPQVQTIEYRGQQLILRIYEAIASDPARLLKENFSELHQSMRDDISRKRIICDYIAGMTDEYATRMYERLFVPRQGHVFDRF